MSSDEKSGPHQWEDILEGVDIIGTLIDQQLPQMAKELQQINERLDGLSGQLEFGTESDSGESLAAELRLRLDLLEQRFLNYERASQEGLGELLEKLEMLSVSLSEIHEELADLKQKPAPRSS